MEKIRLQKFLAQAGVASRRKAEELIRLGRVSVNGVKITEMGYKVTDSDRVELDGKHISIQGKKVYIMLNKPVGCVTTVKDQFGRLTVLDFVKEINERLYPVGRLDYDTSGLLLLTNDGEFTYILTHPKHEIEKTYLAEVLGYPTDEEISRLKKGVDIGGFITSPAQVKLVKEKKDASILEITIHEGKNRQVRKMCEAIGHPVKSLKRIRFGGLSLGGLEEGKWRYLEQEEVERLIIISGRTKERA